MYWDLKKFRYDIIDIVCILFIDIVYTVDIVEIVDNVDIVDIADTVKIFDIVDIGDIVGIVDIVDIVGIIDTVDIFSNLEQCYALIEAISKTLVNHPLNLHHGSKRC